MSLNRSYARAVSPRIESFTARPRCSYPHAAPCLCHDCRTALFAEIDKRDATPTELEQFFSPANYTVYDSLEQMPVHSVSARSLTVNLPALSAYVRSQRNERICADCNAAIPDSDTLCNCNYSRDLG